MGAEGTLVLIPDFHTLRIDEAMPLSDFLPLHSSWLYSHTFDHLSASCHSYQTSQSTEQTHKQSRAYVVVNFLCQVIFIFPLFQLHYHTLPYPKAK